VKPRQTPLFAYVGSFTTKERNARGDGINVYEIDAVSGAWSHIQHVADFVNPSFLVVDRAQRFLYSAHGDLTEISAFAIDRSSGKLGFLNRQSSGGKNPAHLAIDPGGRFVVTANYAAGSISVLPIEQSGRLGSLRDTAALPGDPGPHRIEQASAHPHDIVFDPAGRHFFVPDKGLDRVFAFRLDPATGKLAAGDPPAVKTRDGAGPRHIAFHPTLPRAYVINELDSTIATYRYDAERGALAAEQVVPSIPADFTADNTGSEIELGPSGRFLYASNRGHDSIAAFAVAPSTGLLSPIDWQSTQGKGPRHFTFAPSADLIYAGNEQSDTIVAFRVDRATGKLTPTGQVVKNASPSCILITSNYR
jgi:6-phosphogluconolactonase